MKRVIPPLYKFLPIHLLLVLGLAGTATRVFADEYEEVRHLMRSGKLNDAVSTADQFLSTRPRDPQMQFLKGLLQRDTQKTAEAIATFTRLTQDYPELPEPYNNLAVLYAGQNQFDKARAALEMAIRINPSYATAHENLGDVLLTLASQSYNRALQLEAGNSTVTRKLAITRELMNPTPNEVRAAQQPVTQKKE